MAPGTGDMAPRFRLPDQGGNLRSLDEFLGQWVLLYFYPKDDTPGCTLEACGFRDRLIDFVKLRCQVIGISTDPVRSHRVFSTKYNLGFPLLSDAEKQVVAQFGVWREKKMYGKTYMGTVRISFLIDPTGKIVKVYPGVSPEEHPEDVLEDLRTFQG